MIEKQINLKKKKKAPKVLRNTTCFFFVQTEPVIKLGYVINLKLKSFIVKMSRFIS